MKLIRIVKRCSCQKKILKIAGSNRNGPNIRSAYLVTYSQVAETWTRETFAKAVVSQFESDEAKVRQKVCSQENHQERGIHLNILF